MQRAGWINGPEIGAFLLTQAIRIALLYVLNILALAPLYRHLVAAGGAIWIAPVGAAVGALMIAATFPLFLGLRAGFAGVPGIVARPGLERSFTSSGPEVGAYGLAGVIVLALSLAVNYGIVVHIFTALRTAGIPGAFVAVSLGLSAVYALVFLGLFIALRRGFTAAQ